MVKQRITGAMLFLIGLLLSPVTNLLSAEPAVGDFYNENRTAILAISAMLLVAGVVLNLIDPSESNGTTKLTSSDTWLIACTITGALIGTIIGAMAAQNIGMIMISTITGTFVGVGIHRLM